MVLSQAVGGMRLGLPTHAGRHAPSLLRGASPGRSASSPAQRRRCCGQIRAVLAPAPVQQPPPQPQQAADLSQAPPFTLADLKNAIPTHCFKRKPGRSMAFLIRDVAFVVGMAVAAHAVNAWWAWPMYWMAQGTMFWALFVVGHDCGHGSFSSNKKLNDVVGNITHSSILVPYHGWRISHRTHHANHGHVENDESWYPTSKSTYDNMDALSRLGRVSFPLSLFAYPFYLMNRSPGKVGSHFDPKCDLFSPAEGKLIQESNKYFAGMLAVLAGCTLWLGPLAMLKLYAVPYWINVMWLDAVTYLHHHGPDDESIKVPWYRGEEWSYLRGGLSTLDRDYGIFNKIHHDIGTHVVHHLLPQIPHYNLCEATEAVKPVMGEYYREPEKSKGPVPFHLVPPLVRSLSSDHFVADEGNIVYYQKDPKQVPTAACTAALVDGDVMLPLSLLMTSVVLLLQVLVHSSSANLRQEGDSASQLVKQRQPAAAGSPGTMRPLAASVTDSTRSAASTEEAIAAAHPAAMAAEFTPSGVLAARAMLSRGQQVAVLGGGGVSHAPNVNQSTLVCQKFKHPAPQ